MRTFPTFSLLVIQYPSVLCDALGMGRKRAIYGHKANEGSVSATDSGVEFQVEAYSSGGASMRRSWQPALQKPTVQEPKTHL